MTRFTSVFFASVVIAILAAWPRPAAAAIEYPWCAQYSGGDDGGGSRNCGFSTWEQCMETVRGAGGFCERNLFYEGPAERPARPPRKRHND